MSVRIVPLDFLGNGAMLEPVDHVLHDKALAFMEKELADGKDIDPTKFDKFWVALEGEEVIGVAAWVKRADIPVFRTLSSEATVRMAHRLNDFFADMGLRGHEVFLHLSSKDTEEQRCAAWSENLVKAGAVPAERYSVKVK